MTVSETGRKVDSDTQSDTQIDRHSDVQTDNCKRERQMIGETDRLTQRLIVTQIYRETYRQP